MSVYILGGKRTAQGSFMGQFSNTSATKLGASAIKGAVVDSVIDASEIDHAYMGNVVQAGVGQAPARQAIISAGLADNIPCSTINKVCGSGLMSIILGAQALKAGDSKLVIAGGMENMSMAPHLLTKSRQGIKFGNGNIIDSMQWDGLWDVYSDQPMGNCAEECARKYELSREAQDQFAISSFKKAQKAIRDNIFTSEIIGVPVMARKKEVLINEDEGPFKAKFDKIPQLRPAFTKNGTITAANASTINDGAAALILGGEKYSSLAKYKIAAYSFHAHHPTWFTTSPVHSMRSCLVQAGLSLEDIGLFEINEAFAVVPMAAIKELKIDPDKVNIYGGAISLGHPIGCSGARIMVTLMNAMNRSDVEYGMASICIGGGESLSMIIKKM